MEDTHGPVLLKLIEERDHAKLDAYLTYNSESPQIIIIRVSNNVTEPQPSWEEYQNRFKAPLLESAVKLRDEKAVRSQN